MLEVLAVERLSFELGLVCGKNPNRDSKRHPSLLLSSEPLSRHGRSQSLPGDHKQEYNSLTDKVDIDSAKSRRCRNLN
jgi:hypothetical protein